MSMSCLLSVLWCLYLAIAVVTLPGGGWFTRIVLLILLLLLFAVTWLSSMAQAEARAEETEARKVRDEENVVRRIEEEKRRTEIKKQQQEQLLTEMDMKSRHLLPAMKPFQNAGRGYLNKITGLTYRQSAVRKVMRDEHVDTTGAWSITVPAVLTREPFNEHDFNAIRVSVGDSFLGYITARKAAEINDDLKAFEDYGFRLATEVVFTGEGTAFSKIVGKVRIPDTTKLLPPSDE